MKLENLEIVNSKGDVVMRLSGNHLSNGGGSVTFYQDGTQHMVMTVGHGVPSVTIGKQKSNQICLGFDEKYLPSFVVREASGRMLYRVSMENESTVSVMASSRIILEKEII